MNFDKAIIHILTLCDSFKNNLHWQITARVSLGSLFLDGRITEETRKRISELITSQKIWDYDILLKR